MSPVLSTLGGASQFGFGRSAKITIQRPVITLDTGYSGSSSSTLTRPRLTSSAFVFSNGVPTTTHASSDWQFSLVSDFSSTISPQTLTASTTNKTSYTISTKFSYSIVIFARVRYRDNASPANISDWSLPISFTTQPQPSINTPTILSPTENYFETGSRQILISTSSFAITGDEDGETHTSTTYQVSNVSDFSSTVYNVTSTANKTSITTSDVGGGTKYIRIRHNGSLGIAISNWSSIRVMSVAWANSGAGVGTYYPDSTSYVVTPSNSGSVTLQPGTYRVSLYGAGGGAAAGGSNGPRRGGYAGCVVKDVYFSTASSISFSLGGGGGGPSNTDRTAENYGGSNGGGAGGDNYWSGAGGGGYSSATFPGSIVMYAAGGGGAAGDGIAEGRSARATTDWYGDKEAKIVRKGTGVGGIGVRGNGGSAGLSELAGGGGAGAPSGAFDTERFNWGGAAYSNITAVIGMGGISFSENNPSTDYRVWSGERSYDLDYRLENYQQAAGSTGSIRPNAWVTDNFKRFNMTDMWPENDEGPYGDLNSDFNLQVLVGYFYNIHRLDGVGTSTDDLDSENFKYYHNASFMAGDGGTNSGSFGRSFADDYGVGNGYYYAAGGYYFGDAGTSSNGWNGLPGGARIQLLTSQNAPSVSITSNLPSSYTANAGDWNHFSIGATDTANTSDNTSITYKWEISTNNGSTWSDIPGANSSTMRRFDKFYYSDNGHRIRCLVTATNGVGSSSTYSNTCTLIVNRKAPRYVEPILPYATSYGTSARISAFTQDGAYGENYWSSTSNYRTLRDIPAGTGRIKFRWNTVIAGEKDYGPSGGSGCNNGYGTSYTYEIRLAVIRVSDNAVVWSSHDRSFNLSQQYRDDPSSDSGRILQTWDFESTVTLDNVESAHRLVIQHKSNTYERCDCSPSGGNPPTSWSNCFNTGQYALFRYQVRSNGYYSRTKALYDYDTRPSLSTFTYG